MKIGLALGGGSARGLAHIPMLEAFDELGLKPSVIAGCSMGALVGALYAGGMSGIEIREHAVRLLSHRRIFAKHVFGTKQTRFSQLFSVSSLLSVRLDGQKLADIALPNDLPQLIEDQKIPLKIIATDYESMEEVVFTKGSVTAAVGASIAIPGVINGPYINGRLHVDGGVKNPVPFNHAKADFTVAIDVTGRPRPLGGKTPSSLELAVGSLLITFNELAQLRRAQHAPEIYITPDVDRVGAADFFRVNQILEWAKPAKEQLKRELDARVNALINRELSDAFERN
ncbi:patatin-like phospholipase family protein [Aestuariivirga litoralis]|uniref:patatin-like phospholipase family protein n=1 Tax=Aestuariivirga litoralis TaxID=2650924 RepID=UPI0018C777F5|nr:patatin-like phospholipase family protein [Aestuariivirga litoralis]MBG1232092.1 patatin-like phospholipase family protein [Aestuariivirga litoralis]